jgi:Mg2+/Co2+ transporter CorB
MFPIKLKPQLFNSHILQSLNNYIIQHVTTIYRGMSTLARSKLYLGQRGNRAKEENRQLGIKKASLLLQKEDAMRTTIKKIATAAVVTIATATLAFAAPAYTDDKGILVWSFLGFCVLIIALIPDKGKARSDDVKIAKGFSTKTSEGETRK